MVMKVAQALITWELCSNDFYGSRQYHVISYVEVPDSTGLLEH